MTDAYDVVARRIHATAGIALQGPHYMRMRRAVDRVAARHRTDAAGIATAARWGSELFTDLLDAVLVGETYWFRDRSQLDGITAVLADRPPGARLVWTPGSSTGQEAYSLAITLHRAGVWPVRIIASDINPRAVRTAQAAAYDLAQERELDDLTAVRYGSVTSAGGSWVVREDVRRQVRVVAHNLLRDPPIPADVVLCRNVLIYFGADEVTRALNRFEEALAPGGVLVLGHAEGQLPAAAWRRQRIAGTFVLHPPAPHAASAAPIVAVDTDPAESGSASVQDLIQRAESAMSDGRWSDAITRLRLARSLQCQDPVPVALLGLALAKAGARAEAARTYTEAVALLDAVPEDASLLDGYPPSAVRAWVVSLAEEAR